MQHAPLITLAPNRGTGVVARRRPVPMVARRKAEARSRRRSGFQCGLDGDVHALVSEPASHHLSGRNATTGRR